MNSSQETMLAETKVSFSPARSPMIASPVICCHQVSVWRSYMMRSLKRSLPVVPKSCAMPFKVRSMTMAELQSGQKVTTTATPPTASFTISCQMRIWRG